jgi:hypothetical protein
LQAFHDTFMEENAPHGTYTPASMNADGSVTPPTHTPPEVATGHAADGDFNAFQPTDNDFGAFGEAPTGHAADADFNAFQPTADDFGAFGEAPTGHAADADFNAFQPTADNFGAFGEAPSDAESSEG